MIQDRSIYTWLIAAGALPFAAGGAALLAGIERLPVFGSAQSLLLSYGLGIASFLTGIHWATSLYLQERSPLRLFAVSNAIFLAVWGSYLLFQPQVAALVQSIAFVALLAIDYRLLAASVIGRGYFRLRVVATAVAVASLLILLWRI